MAPIEAGGEAAVLAAANAAVEEDPLVVASADEVEVVTLASGRKTSELFTFLSSKRRKTG